MRPSDERVEMSMHAVNLTAAERSQLACFDSDPVPDGAPVWEASETSSCSSMCWDAKGWFTAACKEGNSMRVMLSVPQLHVIFVASQDVLGQ